MGVFALGALPLLLLVLRLTRPGAVAAGGWLLPLAFLIVTILSYGDFMRFVERL